VENSNSFLVGTPNKAADAAKARDIYLTLLRGVIKPLRGPEENGFQPRHDWGFPVGVEALLMA
jgi:hypothetical protein